MTRIRIAGRVGDRTVPSWAPVIRLIVVIGLVAGACGDGRQTAVSASPAPGSGAPASPDPSVDASPKPSAWPGNAVLGIEALGAADGPILVAINDFKRGIETGDLTLMRRAADGLVGLDVLLPNLEKIGIFEPMRPFAERYGEAIRGIVAAATALRSAIDAGDADAIETSSTALISSLGGYTDVQPELATWVNESITQRRLLLR